MGPIYWEYIYIYIQHYNDMIFYYFKGNDICLGIIIIINDGN